MSGQIEFIRISPNSTIQDEGRRNVLQYGLSASGPMDRVAFRQTQSQFDGACGANLIEFGMLGGTFRYTGPEILCAFAGGQFQLKINDKIQPWPVKTLLKDGDIIDISAGPSGMYAYCRFEKTLKLAPVLNSYTTNLAAGVGGLEGRALKVGDVLQFSNETSIAPQIRKINPTSAEANIPIRVLPGLHADLLGPVMWHKLFDAPFKISTSLDRMGIRLNDPQKRFDVSGLKSIVSDAVVAGDIQILGDGTPVILMRDHQPVGGYPRIATIIDADQDRLAQMRPNTEISFQSVSLKTAHDLLKAASQ